MNAHVIAIDEGNACLLGLSAKKTVTLAVFAQGIGRAGKVAQKLRTIVGEGLGHIEMVIFGPTILTQHNAQLNLGATNSNGDWLQRLLYAGAFFGTQLV